MPQPWMQMHIKQMMQSMDNTFFKKAIKESMP